MKANRLGRFRIELSLIEDYPEVVRSIMASVIVVRAEQLYAYDHIEYQAISPDFDVCEKGALLPEYNVLVNPDKGYIGMEKRV